MTLKQKTQQIHDWLSKGENTCNPAQSLHRQSLVRMLEALWLRQTEQERDAGYSMVCNGRGFNKVDARRAVNLLQDIRGKDLPIQSAWKAKFMLKKYSKQLAEIFLRR